MSAQSEKLTADELNLVVPLIKLLKKNTDETCQLFEPQITKWFNDKKDRLGFKFVFTPIRLRKLVNHCRVNGLAPIMSSSNGYYYSTDQKNILAMAISLEERAKSIMAGATGLRNIALEIKHDVEKKRFDALGFDTNTFI